MTEKYEEILGKMIFAFPDSRDEVKCLLVKELFNNEEIFWLNENGWKFSSQEFLGYYPDITEAVYFLNEVKKIVEPIKILITMEGGLIQSIDFSNCSTKIEIEVRDFDVDNDTEPNCFKNKEGETYYKSEYTNEVD